MTTSPSWFFVWNWASLPSTHIETMRSSPGMTGLEKRASIALKRDGIAAA